MNLLKKMNFVDIKMEVFFSYENTYTDILQKKNICHVKKHELKYDDNYLVIFFSRYVIVAF